MPRGGGCSFCALPEQVRDGALVKWRAGMGAKSLADWVNGQGFKVTTSMVETCLDRAKHHGRRDNRDEPNVKLGKIAELLERSNIDPEDIEKVQTIRLSEWQGLTKDADGEAQVHQLSGASIVLTPAWDTGPKWVPVDRGQPITVRPNKAPAKLVTAHKTAVVLPDTQIGYWRDIETGALTAFHDEDAIDVALEIVRLVRPDLVVLLGDYLDLAPLSDKFTREAGFALTVQPALDYGVRLLGRIRALVPDAQVVLIEGNHDRRLQNSILNNNLDCFGIKRGASEPLSWPVFSVPYLLRLDELQVEYISGYPAGIFWINDNLACIHGRIARGGNQSTAAAVVDDERVSVIFGHIHRIEMKHKTRRVRAGAKQSQALSPGCLCSTSGVVPSTKGASDALGRPVPSVEDWQQGVAVVTYEEGNAPFGVELVPIYYGTDRRTFFRGQAIA